MFAILRARRAASTEALVLSVPLRPLANKEKPQSSGGIALSLALAEQFKRRLMYYVLILLDHTLKVGIPETKGPVFGPILDDRLKEKLLKP